MDRCPICGSRGGCLHTYDQMRQELRRQREADRRRRQQRAFQEFWGPRAENELGEAGVDELGA